MRVGERRGIEFTVHTYMFPILQDFVCICYYSLDIESFHLSSALNPDSSICVN